MELNKHKKKEPREYPSKKLMDFTDITIMNTPQPQASSTVDRRSLLQGKLQKSNIDEQNTKHRQLNFDHSNVTHYTEESSLGIIQNISSLLNEHPLDELKSKKDCLERERELARNVLKKCSDPGFTAFSKPDKENNVNSSNLQKKTGVSNYSNFKNKQPILSNRTQNRKQLDDFDDKSTETTSIIFEPTEITARSSELNKTPEKTEPFPQQNFSGISYNSNVAEMMAQFGDEEFMSGSKAGSQILADEMSWRKNKFTSIPINNTNDKERLEFSCFSGIIGDLDLTVDGGRISVGEFFKRKCGGTGHLSTASVSDRPSFGIDIKSPQRKGKSRALIDDTITAEDEKESKSADCTKEPSVMSLSSIAQILQDMDSETPRKLVDKILDANKEKRRQRVENNNCAGNTYTVVPSNRVSLPISASTTFLNDKSERNMIQSNVENKLSLDSKHINDLENKTFNELLNKVNFINPKLRKLLETNLEDIIPSDVTLKAKEITNKTIDRLSIQKNQQTDLNTSVLRAEYSMMPSLRQLSQISNCPNNFSNSTSINNDSSLIHDTGPSDMIEPTFTQNDSELKADTLTNSVIKNQSFDTKKVQIGKKTQELCTCLVGIYKEADFELYNGTDRWILCSLKLYQIQGEKDNIKLDLPVNDILIEPDAQKSFKIGVTMPRMGKLTIAFFHIPCSDMVTRKNWYMKHLMCFVPEEPNIKISTPSEESTVNFQMITEDTNNSLPITFENRNSIDVPVSLCLSQNKPELFSIGDCFDDTISPVGNQRKLIHLILKPRQPVTVNIDFKGMSLQSLGGKALQSGVHDAQAKLQLSICFKENEEHFIKEVTLTGAIGSCKLDVLDTQFPLTLQPRISKIINLKNSGSIAISATADVVQSKEDQSKCRDFLICPNNIVLNGGEKLALQISYKPENNKTDNERNAMIRITVGNKLSFYPIIGEKVVEIEQLSAESFHLQRAETPQYLRSVSSPTSPHSLIFNRSGTSGRNSPGSTASGGVAIETVIPIRATHVAVVWGSVKVGKSDTKQLTIRNTSNNKIKLFVTIKAKDQSFKFLKDRHTTASSMTLSLQGTESKTLSVIFAPNLPKAAAGKIIFSHYSSVRESRQVSGLVKVVNLFGYGGCGKIQISQAVKDTSGQMWLSLGKLNSEGILHAKIKLHNTGDLICFAKVKLIPKALYPSVLSSWHIEPTELLLSPDEIQWVTLDFRPRKDDLTIIHQTGVIHVGTLKITHGDEPTRLRIRRLYKKLKDSGLHDKIEGYADEFKDVIQPICKAFPGELFTQDLKLIGDSVQNLGDLCKGIVQNEVKLTIETLADETISMLQDNMDDSQTFYSLCSDHNNESHFGVESFLPTN